MFNLHLTRMVSVVLGFTLYAFEVSAQDSVVGEVGEALTMERLIQSIRGHHPVIMSAQARREQADTAPQRARGAFDLEIQQNTLSRLNGYYDGQYLEQAISQPLEFAGAEITASFRRSEGDFPIYEDFYNTLSGGEASVGLSFSLLRDRDLDARRAGLFEAPFTQRIGEFEEELAVNQLLFDGLNTYLNWYQASLAAEVAASLVDLAETRREGIESRVASGDLAAITLTEFETTLLTRQIDLQEAQQNLLRAEQQLLFYWRSGNGGSFNSSDLILPQLPVQWPFDEFRFDQNWQSNIIGNHPSVQQLEAELEIARNQARLAENNFLPQLDFEVKLGNDFGSGSMNLNGPESYVGLNFSMPLQRNRARAERTAATARVSELSFSRQAQVDRLSLGLNESLLQLNTFDRLRQLRTQQAEVAKQLELQEHARFDAGDSDQFLLNARETAAGQAQLEAIAAEVAWLRQKIALLALGTDLLDF
ncbi:MAG: TolC family protein [Proteobacteria bacterium]|nr:TolC family protein [Pseudomonadota bacterium]MDA0927895.1 TolC family protein [Pseudomonadota bacterium]